MQGGRSRWRGSSKRDRLDSSERGPLRVVLRSPAGTMSQAGVAATPELGLEDKATLETRWCQCQQFFARVSLGCFRRTTARVAASTRPLEQCACTLARLPWVCMASSTPYWPTTRRRARRTLPPQAKDFSARICFGKERLRGHGGFTRRNPPGHCLGRTEERFDRLLPVDNAVIEASGDAPFSTGRFPAPTNHLGEIGRPQRSRPGMLRTLLRLLERESTPIVGRVSILCRVPRPTARDLFVLALHSDMLGR